MKGAWKLCPPADPARYTSSGLPRTMSQPPEWFHSAVYWPSRRVRGGFTPALTLEGLQITLLFYSYAA